MEEQLRAVMDKYKYKRRQIRELQEDLQTMNRTMNNLGNKSLINQVHEVMLVVQGRSCAIDILNVSLHNCTI